MVVPANPPGNQRVPTPPPGQFNPSPGPLGTTPFTPSPQPPGGGNPPPPTGPNQMQPGSDVYDWWAVNEALRAAGMGNGDWNIAGGTHSPINVGQMVKNPEYDPDLHPELPQYVQQPGSTYQIAVVNNKTGQMLKLTLGQNKQPDGTYGWTILGREAQGKLDTTQPGYTGIQRLPFADGHEELWGVNTQTGAFEKMAGAPQDLGKLTGWNDIKQIDDGQGHLIWVGTDPATGKPLTPIPGQPQINTAKYVPGSVKQVTKNGKQVYVGQNAQTQTWEDIPELGSEPAKIDTTTVGKTVYKQNPSAGQPGQPDFIPVTGLAQAQENDTQWIDAGGGFVKQQTFHNGDWHDNTDIPWKAVSPTTQAAQGALKPKGTKYWQPMTGSPDTLIEVTADGNGGFTYEPGANGEPPRTMRIPGIQQPQPVTGAGSGEFLPQRRDPYTQQLLPPEKNINWSPTTPSERVRQLQQQATAKQQEIHAQVTAGTLTEDQANKQFLDWWSANVEPAKKEIQLAQQQSEEAVARQNLQTAQTSANEVLRAVQGNAPPGNSPAYAAALGGVLKGTKGAPQGIDYTAALSAPAPNYADVYDQATARALAHISPTAAQKLTGQPVPTGNLATTDITSGLNATNFTPGLGGVVPMPQPVNAPPAQPIPMAQPAGYDWNALQQRLLQDQLEQQQQAQVQFPGAFNYTAQPYVPPF